MKISVSLAAQVLGILTGAATIDAGSDRPLPFHSGPKVISAKKNIELKAKSRAGKHLLQHARKLEGNDAMDFSFVSGYAIKFQGCHHISQWNADADEEDEVRIQTKRLVRFRLCPVGSCSDSNSAGCSSKYGDYVVDMNTFVYSYLEAQEEEMEYQCEKYEEICEDACNDGDDDNCEYSCYAGYGLTYCMDENNDDGQAAFEPLYYAQCGEYELEAQNDDNYDDNYDDGGRRLDEDIQYYVGPFCADQGGEIHLGVFSDNTCTTFVSGGKNLFYSNTGYELPYASESLIPSTCMSCAEPGDDEDGYDDYDVEYDVKEVCQEIYQASGKCETKMNVDYPNEAACTYLEGIKIIREDGVIRTTSTRKSKAAAVCIGLFTTIAVLLGAYVYYLRTKLGRAKINLSSGGSMV